jgi:hypothetical protein
MPKRKVAFLVTYLFDGDDGHAVAERIDRLSGQSEFSLPGPAVPALSRREIAA